MGNVSRFVAAVVTSAIGAHAAMFAIDPVPGATVLLPYFEVDLDNPDSGVNTTFVLHNALASAGVAHIVIYTDYAVPTLFFDVYMIGYDTEEFDLREIFLGNTVHLAQDTRTGLPSSASTTNALLESGFETGTLEEWDDTASRISGQGLTAYHRGESNLRAGDCAGHDHSDGILRGYVVIDEANEFGAGVQRDAGYFTQGGAGLIGNENRFWGEFEIRDPANNDSFSNALISIEADDTAFVPGEYTFYGSAVNATAADNREPLGQTWQTRFVDAGEASGETDIVYWRDPKAVQAPLACGTSPVWYPLGQQQIQAYDEMGNVGLVETNSFPLACGRVAVESDALPVSTNFGYLFVILNFENPQTNLFADAAQGVFFTHLRVPGRFGAGMMGVPSSIAGR